MLIDQKSLHLIHILEVLVKFLQVKLLRCKIHELFELLILDRRLGSAQNFQVKSLLMVLQDKLKSLFSNHVEDCRSGHVNK